MRNSWPVVAIVDAYSSGHALPHWFRSFGYDCIHVSSSAATASRLHRSFRPQDFCANIEHDGDFSSTLAQIKRFRPAAVLAGSESGVLLADEIAAALPGVPNNGLPLSAARRDKAKMSAALREKGVNAIAEANVSNPADAVRWAETNDKWPVIVKPRNSAGGDSVTVCESAVEVADAVQILLGAKNKMDLLNESVLLQEFLDGEIYSVNTVSCEGKHFISHIWQYRKRGILYDHEFLIPAEGPLQTLLSAYAVQVLNAMEISYGPAHIEMILRDRVPVVIDFGARLHGCDSPALTRECTGVGQDELTAAAFVDREAFFSKTSGPYHVYKNLMTVDFISPIEGKVASLLAFDKLRSLESFYLLRLDIEIGDEIMRTVDLFTSPGLVELVHRDFGQLERDRDEIRALEQSSLYEILE